MKTRYLFFGGKGGVGKTTAASAAALHLLERAPSGETILLFSTDPAHSLSDSLDMKIGDRFVEVARKGASRLIAREMDSSAALAKFKTKHRATLAEIADRGTLLDESDINQLLDLSLPGMDEVMALFELSELDRGGDYTHIVVDTAPSGHTSRMLRLPEVFAHWARALDLMAEKHRYMVSQFVRARPRREDEVDLFIRDIRERLERVRKMLYTSAHTAFTLVAIPEAMSVEETVRYYELLRREGVAVTDLIINRVEQQHNDCRYCRARVSVQKPWLKRIAREFKDLRLREVPLFGEEVRGLQSLKRFARVAWDEVAQDGVLRHKPEALVAKVSKTEKGDARFALEPRRLLIFGGKGGVGKTTAAAAAALALAEDRSRRMLIFSTDPAHSLSDSFDERVGELKYGLAGLQNLDGVEVDPSARFERFKERYRQWTDELFKSLTGESRWQIQFDREAMRELIALAPPGIDEIVALSAISNLLDEDNYTSIILDTAPTGHLVRFLELPDIALSWVRTFLKLLLKYKDVVRWGEVAEELIALSKAIKRVAAMLADPKECEFIGVTIAERMGLEETLELTWTLERLKVPMRRLLINNVVPVEAAAQCGFCRARRAAQESVIEAYQKKFDRAVKMFVAPQQANEVRGPELLRKHFENWRSFGVDK